MLTALSIYGSAIIWFIKPRIVPAIAPETRVIMINISAFNFLFSLSHLNTITTISDMGNVYYFKLNEARTEIMLGGLLADKVADTDSELESSSGDSDGHLLH